MEKGEACVLKRRAREAGLISTCDHRVGVGECTARDALMLPCVVGVVCETIRLRVCACFASIGGRVYLWLLVRVIVYGS